MTRQQQIMVDSLMVMLYRNRFDLSSEKATQASIAEVFMLNSIHHEREYSLALGSIIDFWLKADMLNEATGIGIEVKLDGAAPTIFRQLERYCITGKLAAIILITNRSMGLPKEIAGVPAYYVSLGKNWL